jgi:hypothetical protein
MCLSQVLEEQTSGTMDQTFVNHRFLNSYKNLSNVVLRIAPKTTSRAKSLLVSAHFDSTLGTPGNDLEKNHLCLVVYVGVC